MYRYILFDLDGTLSDPKQGICTCVQVALSKLGIEEPDIDKLVPFIGPPLRDSFKEFYGMSDEDAAKGVEYYRERYSTIGKFENELYPGIPELLKDLKKKDKYIAIASSKPTVFVEDILNHFEIREYFDLVVGSELDGSRDTKEAVLEYALQQMFPDSEIDYDETVMIGDRKFDIEAAHKFGIGNIGIGYGYGTKEELEEAGADKIVNTVQGLRTTLLPIMNQGMTRSVSSYRDSEKTTADAGQNYHNSQNTSGNGQKQSGDWKSQSKNEGRKSLANTWGFIAPIVLYWLGSTAFFYVLIILLGSVCGQNETVMNWVTAHQDTVQASLYGSGCVLAAFIAVFTNYRKKKRLANLQADENAENSESENAKNATPIIDFKPKGDLIKPAIYCLSVPLLAISILGITNRVDLWRYEAVNQYANYMQVVSEYESEENDSQDTEENEDKTGAESTDNADTASAIDAADENSSDNTAAYQYISYSEEELNEAYDFFFGYRYSWNYILGFVLFGILIPLGESFVFIKFAFVKAKSFMMGMMPLVLVSLLYAFSSSNAQFSSTVESIVGVVVLFAAINAYDKTSDFMYATVAYIIAKALVWALQSTGALREVVKSPIVFGIAALLAIGGIVISKNIKTKSNAK